MEQNTGKEIAKEFQKRSGSGLYKINCQEVEKAVPNFSLLCNPLPYQGSTITINKKLFQVIGYNHDFDNNMIFCMVKEFNPIKTPKLIKA